MEFHLEEKEFIQLNTLLKWAKLVGTGGEANIRIENGEVTVNGQVETRKRHKLRKGYVVLFEGNEIIIV
jgi:ribosome-associated protein